MRRDLLLLSEMIDAAERAGQLADGVTTEQLHADRMRSDALLWNFTVPGEAAAQLSDEIKTQFPQVPRQQPARLRNRIVHGYWSIDMDILHTTGCEQLPSFAGDLRKILGALTANADDTPAARATPATGPSDQSPSPAEPPEDTASEER